MAADVMHQAPCIPRAGVAAAHADVVHQAQAVHALDVANGRKEEDFGDCVAAVALL